MTNSNNSAILFCALEFVCNLFLYYDRNTDGLATLTTFKWRSGQPTFCISAMILVALQNNSLIGVLCNKKYFFFVKFISSVFIFPLIISIIQKKLAIPKINKILQRKFRGIPAKLPQNFCGRKTKLAWVLRSGP